MQARRRQPLPGMTGASSHLMTWSICALWHLFLSMPILQRPFKLHTEACGSGLGAVLYQTHDDGTDAVIAYASRSLTKAETHYPTHKLEFLTLKWAMVEKFHKYLYGLTFNIYTDNNPLTYMLLMAKLDARSHWWVASLANYNFQLYYRAGKTNIDADALLRVSWPSCMPKASGTHHWITAVAIQALQEATLEGPTSSIEAYSCDLHILDPVGDSLQVTCMTADDWCQAQRADPVLSLMIARMQDGTLGQSPCKPTDPVQTLQVPLRMQPPQAEMGHSV